MNTIETFEALLKLVHAKHMAPFAFEWAIQNKHSELVKYSLHRYFPAPLVGLILRQMHDLRPDEFVPLHIISRGIGGAHVLDSSAENRFTTWLPLPGGKAGSAPESVWDAPGNVGDANLPSPELVLARYVAAMVIGRAVSFAPQEIVLDYYCAEARSYWGDLVEQAIRENGGPLMQCYCTEIGCEPSLFQRVAVLKNMSVSPNLNASQSATANRLNPSPACLQSYKTLDDNRLLAGKKILGIDVGGSSIKIGQFAVEIDDEVLQFQEISNFPIEQYSLTAALGNTYGKGIQWTAEDFVEELKKKAVPGLNDLDNVAVGVSLAAPVGKATGRPLAYAGALNKYFNVTGQIAKANPVCIHKIDLEKALKERLESRPCVVKVLNDGDAEIKDSEDGGAYFGKPGRQDSGHCQEGVTVELKAGTGIAVAVFRDGKPWEISAESAKAILNLLVSPQQGDSGETLGLEERFQQGVVGNFCSKNGINRLSDFILYSPAQGDCFKHPGEQFLRPLLNGLLGYHKACDKLDILLGGSPTYQYFFAKNLSFFDRFEKSLDDLLFRALTIRQLHLAVESSDSLHRHREALLGRLNAKPSQDLGNCSNPVRDMPAPGRPCYKRLRRMQRYAVGLAWVLGRWLADAIALVADIFDAREIRLGGGPLSEATGIFVVASAELALQDVYGYDLEVIWDPMQDGLGKFRPTPIARHRVREMKRLRLIYPPHKEGETSLTGARGAAKAAFEAWVVHVKQEQLLYCRDYVQRRPKSTEPITPGIILDDLRNRPDQQKTPILITPEDVSAMLAQESAALGLTRTVTGAYRKYRH